MSYAAIAELVIANRLTVFTLLERATDKIIASPHVTHVYVRGSLVHGTADRLSDLDFVAGVADEHFCDFCNVLDALMTAELNAILPGWRDSIVIPMGGLGYVYLIENAGKLQQLDFYLVPTSRAPTFPITPPPNWSTVAATAQRPSRTSSSGSNSSSARNGAGSRPAPS